MEVKFNPFTPLPHHPNMAYVINFFDFYVHTSWKLTALFFSFLHISIHLSPLCSRRGGGRGGAGSRSSPRCPPLRDPHPPWTIGWLRLDGRRTRSFADKTPVYFSGRSFLDRGSVGPHLASGGCSLASRSNSERSWPWTHAWSRTPRSTSGRRDFFCGGSN